MHFSEDKKLGAVASCEVHRSRPPYCPPRRRCTNKVPGVAVLLLFGKVNVGRVITDPHATARLVRLTVIQSRNSSKSIGRGIHISPSLRSLRYRLSSLGPSMPLSLYDLCY